MAELTSAAINDLPDSDFAYIEPGGKVVGGKTEPRSLRHFPIHDAAHVRNALARAGQSPFGMKAMPKIRAAARKFGIDMPDGKASELKAEPLTSAEYEAWLNGSRARRILVLPFGGPWSSPHNKAGVDIDEEFFHEGTDLYGPYPWLKASRERIVDFHHDMDPTGVMKGALLGRVIFDDHPETATVEDIPYTGYWGDFWANKGEQRRKYIADLELRRHAALFGSSKAIKAGIVRQPNGAIDVWPLAAHTISTSPQNTFAVVPAIKASLDDDPTYFDDLSGSAIKAFLLSLDDLTPSLAASPLVGEPVVKAGRVLSATNEAALRRLIGELSTFVDGLSHLAPDEPTTIEEPTP